MKKDKQLLQLQPWISKQRYTIQGCPEAAWSHSWMKPHHLAHVTPALHNTPRTTYSYLAGRGASRNGKQIFKKKKKYTHSPCCWEWERQAGSWEARRGPDAYQADEEHEGEKKNKGHSTNRCTLYIEKQNEAGREGRREGGRFKINNTDKWHKFKPDSSGQHLLGLLMWRKKNKTVDTNISRIKKRIRILKSEGNAKIIYFASTWHVFTNTLVNFYGHFWNSVAEHRQHNIALKKTNENSDKKVFTHLKIDYLCKNILTWVHGSPPCKRVSCAK